jgi:hypothetical protein
MICVDASVAIKWLLNEERSDRASTLYEATATANQPIVAPALLPLEVTNILRQRMRAQNGISLIRATEHLAAFLALPIEFHNPRRAALSGARPRRCPGSTGDVRCSLPGAGRASWLRALDGRPGTDAAGRDQPALRALARRSPGDRSLTLRM